MGITETLLLFPLFYAGTFLAFQAVHTLRCGIISKQLARCSSAFSSAPDQPRERFLILGDSTAFGTGAEHPSLSIAGRIAADFPDALIDNRSRNGLSTGELLKQLSGFGQEARFGTIIVHIGGIDTLSFVPIRTIRKNLENILDSLSAMQPDRIVLFYAMNIGLAPMFWFPVNLIFGARTRAIRRIYAEISGRYGALFIDNYRASRSEDPFSRHPGFYAPDGIHPNGAGYGIWYGKLRPFLLRAKL